MIEALRAVLGAMKRWLKQLACRLFKKRCGYKECVGGWACDWV